MLPQRPSGSPPAARKSGSFAYPQAPVEAVRKRVLAKLEERLDMSASKRMPQSLLRQSLRQHAESAGSQTPTVDANAQASVLTAFAIGRLQRFARSGFRKSPTEHLDVALRLFAA